MPFVMDASIIAAWALPDESDAYADWTVDRLEIDVATAPLLWRAELHNLLLISTRRQRITHQQAIQLRLNTLRLPIRFDDQADETRAFALAFTHQLSFYDALYLELAKRQGVPLATLDRQLAIAAAAEQVEILSPG